MFDLYLIHIIGNAVKYYRSDRALFDPLFPHISGAMRDRMFDTLQNTTVSFDAAYNARTAKQLPLVTVESSEQYYDEQGLGQASGGYLGNDGRDVQFNHIFTSQEASVSIYADNLETVRLISMIVQAGMLTFKDVLIKAAFQNIIYVGSTSLVPDPAFAGEDLATYGRQMRYAGLHLLELPAKQDLDRPVYDIQVQHESQRPDGSTINGRVSV